MTAMTALRIAVVWQMAPTAGAFHLTHGKVAKARIATGEGALRGTAFTLRGNLPARLELSLSDLKLALGPDSSILQISAGERSFSVLVRDLSSAQPVWVPACGAAVLLATDMRDYAEVAAAVQATGTVRTLTRLAQEPEESHAQAAARTRRQQCPIWLGLGRDMRIFEVGYNPLQGYVGFINPRYHGHPRRLPEVTKGPAWYGLVIGRGAAVAPVITRRLDEGCLPILHLAIQDDEIHYDACALVSLERQALSADTVRGTHFLVADAHGYGCMHTPAQKEEIARLTPAELERDEELVLYLRVTAVNQGRVPRHAWFKNIYHGPDGQAALDPATGMNRFTATGRVFSITRLNGAPLPAPEMAVLLPPGGTVTWEIALPHGPLPPARATALAEFDFAARLAEVRAYWRAKLASAGEVHLPEPVMDQMVKAGLLHLDLVAYGLEPAGSLAACIGHYCPIGSESAPIIQFFDAMGWHGVAERAIGYFLDKQHDTGFIQNFGGYMLETGPALWTIGEHFRYTRDLDWARRVAPKVQKACEYLLAWRQRNCRDDLRGRGYGLLEGKVADPEDPFHSFMLNGYACLGLARAAEVLAAVDPALGQRWADEARMFRAAIREAFLAAQARGPVVPLGDGTWVPGAAPWCEARGLLMIFTEPGTCWTHGTFTARDSMLGPLYLVLSEVLDPSEPATQHLLDWHAELMCQHNVALSQPYYARHDWIHARRGEVKPFLKTWYNGCTALADRETYTWWEHLFQVSPHKTHEEAWFLMQTRWLLWQEHGEELRLLPLIPRAWLADGQELRLIRVASYFGPFNLRVRSDLANGVIRAELSWDATRAPARCRLRLPHPLGQLARGAEGGSYDASSESVLIICQPGSSQASVTLRF